MYFDDGTNPWVHADNYIQVFKYNQSPTLDVSFSMFIVAVLFNIIL